MSTPAKGPNSGLPIMGRWRGVIASLAGSFVVYALTSLGVVYFTGSAVAGSIGAALAAVACFLVVRRLATGSVLPAPSGGLVLSHPATWGGALTALVGAFGLGQGLAIMLYERFGSPAFDVSQQAIGSAPVGLTLLLVLVVAPLGEEALMRGVFYARLGAVLPLWAAAVLSSSLFALLHGNIVQIAASLPLALVLCAVYSAFGGRLWPVVLLHALFNLAAILIPAQAMATLASPAPMTLFTLMGSMGAVYLVEAARSH